MSNTQIAKRQTKDGGLKGLINQENVQTQIARALPSHLTSDRFLRVATTALSRVPKLADCTPDSFMRCLLDLSALGLEPDGRRAHLIPYGKECTLVLDYKGIVELVRRSGEVVDIHCDVVCENDVFHEDLGQVVTHSINRREPRGKVFAAYSRVRLKDGSTSCEVMSRDEVEAIRKRSKAGSSGPWVSDWNEMAKKTVFRRHSKWLPLSSELRDHVERDDQYQFESATRNVTPASTANPFASAAKLPAPEGDQEPEAQVEVEVEVHEAEPEPPVKKVAKPAKAKEDQPSKAGPKPDKRMFGVIQGVESEEGETDGKPWTLHKVFYELRNGESRTATTFSSTVAELAVSFEGKNAVLGITDDNKLLTVEAQ